MQKKNNTKPTKKKKQPYQFSKARFNGRICIAGAFFVVIMGYMVYQVSYIKFVHGEDYQRQVYTQLMSRESTLNPQRGNILDRNNKTLATSFLTYDITLSPRDMMEEEEEDWQVIYEALALATGQTAEEIKALVEKNPSSKYALLAKNVENDKISELKKTKLKGKPLTGV